MLIHDTDAVPPVMASEIILQSSLGARGPWASGKGAGALFFVHRNPTSILIVPCVLLTCALIQLQIYHVIKVNNDG